MDALTRIIAPLFPGLAASRIAAQAKMLAAQRYYDAVASNAYRPRRGGNQSADTVIDQARGKPREYARWLDENHDLASGILNDLVTNIVGSGVRVEPMAKTKDGLSATTLNDALRDLWVEFWKRPTVAGDLSGPELESLTCRTLLRDGELFVQHVIGRKNITYPLSGLPYLLEPLEADFVPFDLTTDTITQGIQKNTWGQPVAYTVYKQHPGGLRFGASMDVKIVAAEAMSHLKFKRRLGQTRGITIFHNVLSRLDDIKDYEESERIAARIAAAFTAYIKRSGEYEVPSTTLADGVTRSFEMAPGLIWDTLAPGEDVGIVKSDRPNPNLQTFRSSQLRASCAGTQTRYSSVAKDYNGTYSAQRQEMLEGEAGYRALFGMLLNQFYLPIWIRFVDTAIAAGSIRIPANVVLQSVYLPEIRKPALPWIDPLKEVNAFAKAVEQGFKSRHQVIRDMGGDPRIVDQQLAADTFDVRPDVAPTTQPKAPPDDPQPIDEAA